MMQSDEHTIGRGPVYGKAPRSHLFISDWPMQRKRLAGSTPFPIGSHQSDIPNPRERLGKGKQACGMNTVIVGQQYLFQMIEPVETVVGTRGFEPPTPRTPSVCATRLRYVPTQG